MQGAFGAIEEKEAERDIRLNILAQHVSQRRDVGEAGRAFKAMGRGCNETFR